MTMKQTVKMGVELPHLGFIFKAVKYIFLDLRFT